MSVSKMSKGPVDREREKEDLSSSVLCVGWLRTGADAAAKERTASRPRPGMTVRRSGERGGGGEICLMARMCLVTDAVWMGCGQTN